MNRIHRVHVVKRKMKDMLPIGCGLGDSRGSVGQYYNVWTMKDLPADLLVMAPSVYAGGLEENYTGCQQPVSHPTESLDLVINDISVCMVKSCGTQ